MAAKLFGLILFTAGVLIATLYSFWLLLAIVSTQSLIASAVHEIDKGNARSLVSAF